MVFPHPTFGMDPAVYREYSADFVSNLKDIGWQNRPRDVFVLPPRGSYGVNDKGPMSLFLQAARAAAQHFEDFDDEYLDSLSPNCKAAIWSHLGRLPQALSLKGWRFGNGFLDKYGGIKGPHMRCFYHHIPEPTADDFTVYTAPLQTATATFEFVSHLRIAGPCSLKIQDLFVLPSMKNLGILEIIEPIDTTIPFPRISDRLIKMWSEKQEEKPFPNLKILKIHSQHTLTDKSLPYLSVLDKLCMVEVRGDSDNWRHGKDRARECGWVHCKWTEKVTHVGDEDDDDRAGPRGRWDYAKDHETWRQLTAYVGRAARRFEFGGYTPITRTLSPSARTMYWGCWLHDLLGEDESKTRWRINTPIIEGQENGNTAQHFLANLEQPVQDPGSGSSSFVSLCLGTDKQIAQATASHGGWVGATRIFFWRYWLPDHIKNLDTETTMKTVRLFCPQDDGSNIRHPRPVPPPSTKEGAVQQGGVKKNKNKNEGSATQPLKRRRVGGHTGNLRDILGDLQG